MKTIYLITGPAGVGKTTISNIVANRLTKSCLLEGDDIYNLVKGGYVSPWKKENHLDLFWQNAFCLIENCLNAGFDVVFNYILNKKDVKKIKKQFLGVQIKFAVLLVNENVLLSRDKERPSDCQMGERCLVLLNDFLNENFNESNIIETSSKTKEEIAELILNSDKFNIQSKF